MKKSTNNLIYVILIIVFLIAIIYLFTGIIKGGNDKNSVKIKPDFTEEVVNVEQAVNEPVIIIDTINEGLNDIGLLITQEYFFTMVEEYSQSDPMFDNIEWTKDILKSTKKVIFQYDGTVYAGVEFGEIRVESNDDESKVIIEMPDAQITDVTIDNNSFKLHDEKNGIWNKFSMEDYNTGVQELKDAAQEKALSNKILENADANAQRIVENMVRSIVGDDVTIEFK